MCIRDSTYTGDGLVKHTKNCRTMLLEVSRSKGNSSNWLETMRKKKAGVTRSQPSLNCLQASSLATEAFSSKMFKLMQSSSGWNLCTGETNLNFFFCPFVFWVTCLRGTRPPNYGSVPTHSLTHSQSETSQLQILSSSKRLTMAATTKSDIETGQKIHTNNVRQPNSAV